MTDDERLAAIEARLDRLERMVYVVYDDIRRVAEYAYLNVKLERDASTVKRMSHMRTLSMAEAERHGMDIRRQIAIKSVWKVLGFAVRHDALAIAKEISEHYMRRAGELVDDNAKVEA